jgi:putative transposase
LSAHVKQVSDQVWLVTFVDYGLGFFDEVAAHVEPRANAFASKVLTMSPV